MRKNSQMGGGGGVYRVSFFLLKTWKGLCLLFFWQDPMTCASVGSVGVWTRNTKNTIVVVKITTYAHFCCKNHKLGTFVSKFTTFAFFCRKNHNICALLSRKSQHMRTLRRNSHTVCNQKVYLLNARLCVRSGYTLGTLNHGFVVWFDFYIVILKPNQHKNHFFNAK